MPTGGGPPLFVCPDGTAGLFCFLPNPNLRPEVGKNKEIGLNLKYNDIFTSGDSFRGKFNVFRNDVDDYIDLVASHADADAAVRHRSASSSSTRTLRMPGSKASRPRRCTTPACGIVGVAGHLIRRQERRDQYRACDHHAAQDHDDRRRAAARSHG